jgi:hypothetical protein
MNIQEIHMIFFIVLFAFRKMTLEFRQFYARNKEKGFFMLFMQIVWRTTSK